MQTEAVDNADVIKDRLESVHASVTDRLDVNSLAMCEVVNRLFVAIECLMCGAHVLVPQSIVFRAYVAPVDTCGALAVGSSAYNKLLCEYGHFVVVHNFSILPILGVQICVAIRHIKHRGISVMRR